MVVKITKNKLQHILTETLAKSPITCITDRSINCPIKSSKPINDEIKKMVGSAMVSAFLNGLENGTVTSNDISYSAWIWRPNQKIRFEFTDSNPIIQKTIKVLYNAQNEVLKEYNVFLMD